MWASSPEWRNGTSTPLPDLDQAVALYHTAVPAAAGAAQLPTATARALDSDAFGTLSPRASHPPQGRARGWHDTSRLRGLADSPGGPMLAKRHTSRTGFLVLGVLCKLFHAPVEGNDSVRTLVCVQVRLALAFSKNHPRFGL